MHLSSSDLLLKSKAPASNSKHIISHNPTVTKPSANAGTQKAVWERESHCGFRKKSGVSYYTAKCCWMRKWSESFFVTFFFFHQITRTKVFVFLAQMLCEVIQNMMMCYEILMASCEQLNWFLAKHKSFSPFLNELHCNQGLRVRLTIHQITCIKKS